MDSKTRNRAATQPTHPLADLNQSPDTSSADAANDPSLSAYCQAQLEQSAADHRLRRCQPLEHRGRYVVVDGRELLNLASNDYLALSTHPRLIDAAVEATQAHGVGSGASRLVSGTLAIHEQAERRFAEFKHAEACLLLPTGYAANLAVLTTLAGPGDRVVLDKLVHASLIDAAKASGAEVRTYPHRKLDRAEHLLAGHTTGRCLLVTDSVFSMDGDVADLVALCDLADRQSAVLVVDEAHGTGVLGEDGSGLAEHQGVGERVYSCGSGGVVVSTASKALGSLGGLITASRPVIDLIVNKARPFIYSTAVPPAQAAAIDAAIGVVRDEPERRRRLSAMSVRVREVLRDTDWPIDTQGPATPIIPLITGGDQAALGLAAHLLKHGIYAPAIRPPTVAPGSARVRLSLRADLTDAAVEQLLDAIGKPGEWSIA